MRSASWLGQRFELARETDASNLRPMEGLRGYAVFLVFLVHYATASQPWTSPASLINGLMGEVYKIGHSGVDLFFVLSGYLIYGSLIKSARPFSSYFARRVRRIYPAFLVILAMYLMLSPWTPGHNKLPAGVGDSLVYIAANLLLLPGIFPIEPVIRVAWSLSYEMFYYLAMPLLIAVFALQGRAPRWRLMFFVLMTVAGLVAACLGQGPVRLLMFLAGVLLYEWQLSYHRAPFGTLTAFLALACAMLIMMMPMPGPPLQALRTLILSLSFGLLCFICFTRPEAAITRLFTWTPLRWLGNMSYSYYLIHGLALKAFFLAVMFVLPPGGGPEIALWLIVPAFIVTLLPAALLFLLVERPMSLVPRRHGTPSVPVSARA